MNQTWPRTHRPYRQSSLPVSSVLTPINAPAVTALGRGHCFGSISVLPPETVQREQLQRDDDDPAVQTDAPDAGVPAATSLVGGSGDGTGGNGTDPAGGAIPLNGSGGGSGSTTVQAPTMQTNVIHGATLADVSNALGAEAGAVDFAINVSQTQGDPITSAVVTVTQIMTLPQWAERDTQCPPAKASWDRFLSALRNHENGHVTIDNQRLASVHQRFVGIAVSDVQTRTDTVTAEVQAVQDAYDTSNNHGTTQTPPTILDTSITCPPAAGTGGTGTP